MLWNPTRGGGSSVTIVDSWEDQDDSEYDGTLTVDNFITSPTLDGSYAAEFTNFDNGYSTSGLNAYPQKGDKFRVACYFPNALQRLRVFFGLESDDSETYELEFDADSSAFDLNTVVGGSRSKLGGITVSPSSATWYEARVTWDDGTLGGSDNDITVEWVEAPYTGSETSLGTIGPVNNSDHATATGVGFNAAGGLDATDSIITDYYHITNR